MTKPDLICVIDEGTTSTRALVYDRAGQVLASHARPLTQSYPAPGLVEHDASEIWAHSLACSRAAIESVGGAGRIAAIGITNQRETVVAWDAASGEPLHPAIVWQDRRTADACAALADAGHGPRVQHDTGLRLDPYFSGTKMGWLARQPTVAAAGDRLRLGTIDSWLAFRLSGGAAHITDASNASRTLLMPLDAQDWSADLCALLGVPRAALPRIVPTAGQLATTDPGLFGRAIPITALVGDQQSATVGQGCLVPGSAKLTLGTGAFALTNVGTAIPRAPGQLLGTVLYDVGGSRCYAIEGSIFVAGSLMQWLRDQLGLLVTAADSEALARSVPDSGGVVLVPALSGLGAPYWAPDARALLCGMSFSTGRAHLARAALEAVTHQCVDLATAFAAVGAPWAELRLDGGMAANDWLAEDLAAMLDVPVTRPADVETTARGAAMLAAVGAGLSPTIEAAVAAMASPGRCFRPDGDGEDRAARMDRWRAALAMLGVAPAPNCG